MSVIFNRIRGVIYDVCVKASASDLTDIIQLEWNDRRIGRTVEVDFSNNPKRAVFSISKPLFLNCYNEDQIIACATCHLISWLHLPTQAIAPGFDTLYGYFEPPKDLDWKAYAESYKDIVGRTCELLNVGDLAEKIDLKWNGRLKRSAGSTRWDADLNRGEIQLAKKIWLQMIDEEQIEALVLGICLIVHSKYPTLAEQLRSKGDPPPGQYSLLRHCGYKLFQDAMPIFPTGNSIAEPIGKPLRLEILR